MTSGKGTRVLGAVLLCALTLGACGGGDEDQGRTGGSITILGSSFPDYLDPGLSYTVDGWQTLNLVYPGLLTYKRQPGKAEVVAGLAEDLPTVSADGRRWEFTLRKGVRFSDGTPVKASDFKCSIERLLEMDSQGAGLGYTTIEGAERFLKTKKGGVPGIRTDDTAGRITINLVEPRGAFQFELAIPFAGVVPCKTPARNQTKNPPPGAGRYMFQPGSVRVNRGYVLVKNPRFSQEALGDTPIADGKIDRFNVRIERSLSNQVTLISQNRADFMIDIPPADRLPEIKTRYRDRFHEFVTNSSFYFFLNNEVPPFNNLKARQAANHAVDVNAINRLQSGTLAEANEILPPGVPGYRDTPDLYPFDLAKARQLVEESGTKGQSVTVWGNPEDFTKKTVEYWADTLNKIGYRAKVKLIPAETYFATIGNRATKAQTGWANWFQDYPHPADFIDVLLNPERVTASGNNNYSYNADDTKLARMIAEVNKEPELTPEVEAKWAAIDKYVQEQAIWVMYGNRKQTTFMSERMDFENCKGEHPVYTHDWAEFCLK
jgi:peptide/nickel transport system substrate-binding protein